MEIVRKIEEEKGYEERLRAEGAELVEEKLFKEVILVFYFWIYVNV